MVPMARDVNVNVDVRMVRSAIIYLEGVLALQVGGVCSARSHAPMVTLESIVRSVCECFLVSTFVMPNQHYGQTEMIECK